MHRDSEQIMYSHGIQAIEDQLARMRPVTNTQDLSQHAIETEYEQTPTTPTLPNASPPMGMHVRVQALEYQMKDAVSQLEAVRMVAEPSAPVISAEAGIDPQMDPYLSQLEASISDHPEAFGAQLDRVKDASDGKTPI